ncbi:DUF3231 family protein [Alteribacillus iranensis]|uniref:DUF3231 family protein n=1 Tax=Alteribacillus iranensis TaxID=930128 RepID=A0A1I2FG54_9BACI|nr:DUF3231 family protein [Alteribacillus iranensis]SFF04392.1 Protein of unknown function [Alteribacillus iranensis]
METTDSKRQIALTSAEISNLWTTYMNNSMAQCVLNYFIHSVEDQEIREIVTYSLDISTTLLDKIQNIFAQENFPIPVGFTENDVNIHASRLFSDELIINYIDQMAKSGFIAYGLSTGLSSRLDIQDLFNEAIDMNQKANKKTKEVLLNKGLHIRPPSLAPPKEVDFVEHQSFLTGWFGRRKPLLAVEIMNIFHNLQTNSIGKAVITGFAQTAQTEDTRDYFQRGKEIASKHVKIFQSLLTKEDIPAPQTWDDDVLPSTDPPFSDKLMMFHVSMLSATGMGNYGASLSSSTRRDLATHYTRLLAEAGRYAEDGANITIKHGWMEQPPQSVNSDDIIKRK